MKKIIIIMTVFCFLFQTENVFADLQSTTYDMKGYGFGSGGVATDSSTTYSLFGLSGQIDQGLVTSTTYQFGAGLTYILQAYVPTAPTLSTPGLNYDRILLVINTANNPSDTIFAVQASTDNFASNIQYVKSDGTLGPTLITSDWRTYAGWNSSSGTFVTGLQQSVTYYFRVAARQGNFTQTPYGPVASTTTNAPALTFTLDTNSITFANLNNGNSYTDSSKSNTLTTTTNAYSGYIVYGQVTRPLTSGSGNTIANYASPNSGPTAWSGTGFGYTTNDTNLAGGTANRFNNGTYYAGFGTTGPGDPVASDQGPVTTTEISNEQFTVSYRVTGNNVTPAGTYSNVILYTIVPTW